MSSEPLRFGDVVRREWWVVVLSLVAALAVGVVLALSAGTYYLGKASVEIDAPTVSRTTGLASPDEVQAAVTGSSFRRKVADETGVSASDLAANSSAFLLGSPAKTLVLQYRARDLETARKVADATAKAAVEASQELGKREIGRVQDLVSETSAAIEDMRRLGNGSWPQSDLRYKVWNAETQLTGYRASLEAITNAYSVVGPSTASQESGLVAGTKSIAAAALLGLVLGVAIAALREMLLRRGAPPSPGTNA